MFVLHQSTCSTVQNTKAPLCKFKMSIGYETKGGAVEIIDFFFDQKKKSLIYDSTQLQHLNFQLESNKSVPS